MRIINHKSLVLKLLIPMVCVLIIQCVIIVLAVTFSGTINSIKETSVSVLNEKINNRKTYLNNELTTRWRNLNPYVDKINNLSKQYIPYEEDYDDLNYKDNLISYNFLYNSSKILKEMIRQNSVTGTFIMLTGNDEWNYRLGMYLRDPDPLLNAADYSDLILEVAPPNFSSGSIIQSNDFNYHFDFTQSIDYDFYQKPLEAFEKFPELDPIDLGFWSVPNFINNKTDKVITYTVPLINEYGKVYAIMGIDLSLKYLNTFLPYKDLDAKGNSSYVLGYLNAEKEFSLITSTGTIYNRFYEGLMLNNEILNSKNLNEISITTSSGKANLVVINFPLNIYNSNTLFSDNTLQLLGVIDATTLYAQANTLEKSIVLAMIFSIIFSIGVILASVIIVTRPLVKLTAKIKNSKQNTGVIKFDKTKIDEIDQLTTAIEELNDDLIESSKKMSQIIALANIPIATFELDYEKHNVFYTDNLFRLIDSDILECTFEQLNEEINKIKEECIIKNYNDEENSYVFKNKSFHWFQLKTVSSKSKMIGVVRDITKEMIEKSQLEYERDYDILADIFNRRAFNHNLKMIFEGNNLKIAAFVMIDLDNLKYINDQYGHDFGDEYIRAMAKVLKDFSEKRENRMLIGRMAGDEFYVFIYGYENAETIKDLLFQIKQKISETYIKLPNNQTTKLRASAGVSWYPQDSDNYEDMIKYADYAMYEIKTSVKGEFHDFDIASYVKESYLLTNQEELNKLIENKLIDFNFQPIIDVKTGEIMAFEALMRSKLSSFRSPKEILNIAKAQSKLGAIEQLTMFSAMEYFCINNKSFNGKKLFINSIANQILCAEDIKAFEDNYLDILKDVVIEITESEKIDEKLTAKKLDYIKNWNGGLAIDDFGTGYNSEKILLTVEPNYIKIDMSIVRNIHQDKNRQNLVANMISYCKERQIKTIAEGVEFLEEYEALIRLGVDYVQGYLLESPKEKPYDITEDKKKELRGIYKEIKKHNKALKN